MTTYYSPETLENILIYEENRLVRKGILLYYDPLLMSDLTTSLSSLNVVSGSLPLIDPTGTSFPAGINANSFVLTLTSGSDAGISLETLLKYNETHVVRRGLLGFYDPLLMSDLFLGGSALSYFNTLFTTLPSTDSNNVFPVGINATMLNIEIPISGSFVGFIIGYGIVGTSIII